MDTITTRKNIGFPKKKADWTLAPAMFGAHTLRIAGHPVMEDWEENYMKTLAKIACSHGGLVLELGYGLGLSAKAIQFQKIDAHYIIECHPKVVSKCIEKFRRAIGKNRLHVLTGFWEDVTPLLADNTFNGILFDTYPLSEEQIHSNHFWFFKEAYRLLKPGGVFTYYSDEANEFSNAHLKKLLAAGFKRKKIDFQICKVNPPENCEYWQEKTIIAPIITK